MKTRSAFTSRFTASQFGICIVALAIVSIGRTTLAAPIAVTNYSFEDPNGGDCCGANATIPGWQFAGGGATGTQNQSPNNPPQTDGQYWAFINLDVPNQTGTITTTVSPTIIAANTKYTLTVALGNNDQPPIYGDPGIDSISILSGATPLATTTVPYGTIPNDTFVDYTVTYISGGGLDPNVGTALNIQLASTSPNGIGQLQPIFDNVRLDATVVPEPSSIMALCGLGAIGLVFALRRRRRTG